MFYSLDFTFNLRPCAFNPFLPISFRNSTVFFFPPSRPFLTKKSRVKTISGFSLVIDTSYHKGVGRQIEVWITGFSITLALIYGCATINKSEKSDR